MVGIYLQFLHNSLPSDYIGYNLTITIASLSEKREDFLKIFSLLRRILRFSLYLRSFSYRCWSAVVIGNYGDGRGIPEVVGAYTLRLQLY